MSRLPNPGSDNGQWGQILNDYLLQSHNANGTIKSGALTKGDIGLGSVDNTTDVDKPISTAQQAALDFKLSKSDIAALRPDITLSDYAPTGWKGTADDKDIWNSALSDLVSLVASGKKPVLRVPSGVDTTIRNIRLPAGTTVIQTGAIIRFGGTNPALTAAAGVVDESQSGIYHIYPDDTSSEISDVQIIGGTMYGDRTDWSTLKSDVIQFARVRRCSVSNVRFVNAGQDCVQLFLGYYCSVTDCTFEDIYDSCVDFRLGGYNSVCNNKCNRVKQLVQSKPGTDDVLVQGNQGVTFGEFVQFHGNRWKIVDNAMYGGQNGDGSVSALISYAGVSVFKNPGYSDQSAGPASDNEIRGNIISGYQTGFETTAQGAPHGMTYITQNTILNCPSGIRTYHSPAIIEGNTISAATVKGIRLETEGVASRIAHNRIINCLDPIRVLRGAGERTMVVANTITGATTSAGGAIHLPRSYESVTHNADNAVVGGNSIEVTGAGINCSGQTGVVISGNSIKATQNGLTPGIKSSVTGNSIDLTGITASYYPITLTEAGVIASGNTTIGGSHGIRVSAPNCVITGNRCTGAQNYGVQVAAGSTAASIVTSNILTGNITGGIQDVGTATVSVNNVTA